MSGRFWRVFLVVGLVLGAFAYGCGRTSLDVGFGPSDASASTGPTGGTGQGGAGIGGMTGRGQGGVMAGQGGIMAGSIVACGSTACVAGKQSCCNHLLSGQPNSCVSSSDPTACNDGFLSCVGDIVCSTSFPKCCLVQAPDFAVCIPDRATCPTPRP